MLISIILILLSLIIFFSIIYSIPIVNLFSIVISFIALAVSIISAFKTEIFPYNLKIFADGLHLAAAGAIPPDQGITVQVLLPITFFNRGYGECFIEKLKLIVKQKDNNDAFVFLPSFEIDMEALAQQNKGVNASNITGTSFGFLLESKKGLKKNILFTPSSSNESQNFIWKGGTYIFEIWAKAFDEKMMKKYYEFEKEIGKKLLSMLSSGNAKILFLN